jgi:hypothetical protein
MGMLLYKYMLLQNPMALQLLHWSVLVSPTAQFTLNSHMVPVTEGKQKQTGWLLRFT